MDISVFRWVIQEPLSDLLSRFERIPTTPQVDTIATTSEQLGIESTILGGVVVPVRNGANPDLEGANGYIFVAFHEITMVNRSRQVKTIATIMRATQAHRMMSRKHESLKWRLMIAC